MFQKIIILLCFIALMPPVQAQVSKYESLFKLARELRQAERISFANGVPDYSQAATIKVQQKLAQLRKQHSTIDTVGWSLEQKVDFVLIRAEMNAVDFNYRILQPWVRDPAFYAIVFVDQSDTPEHEGPTSFAAIDLWKYSFPLSRESEEKLQQQLTIIPPLYKQALINLKGNARDLWEAGIGNLKDQLISLEELEKKTGANGLELKSAITNAKKATENFVVWLQKELPKKNGPSGIGKENYTWHLKNVLMVPFSWEEELTLLKRELTRSYQSLQLERERNRHLPELQAFSTPAEHETGTDVAVKKMMNFLRAKNILPVKDYMEPELRKHIGKFIPEDQRNFFGNISSRAPEVLYAHTTHWFEIARLREEPHQSLIRREVLPYNMWMQRNEGLATFMEEGLMHAGMWDDNPRARELVWIMLAQRCARGIASLYAHANMINYKQARKFQVEWTPKGWTGDESLVGFEQHLYLRQPGYGTSYVTGKYFIEKLIMEMGRKELADFKLYSFFDSLYSIGQIPLSLVQWQMTGDDKEIKNLGLK